MPPPSLSFRSWGTPALTLGGVSEEFLARAEAPGLHYCQSCSRSLLPFTRRQLARH